MKLFFLQIIHQTLKFCMFNSDIFSQISKEFTRRYPPYAWQRLPKAFIYICPMSVKFSSQNFKWCLMIKIQCPLDFWRGVVCCEGNTNFWEQQWILDVVFIHWREKMIKLPKFGTRAYLKGLKRMTKNLICLADLNRFDQAFLWMQETWKLWLSFSCHLNL